MEKTLMRHLLATIGFRASKVIREVPEHFPHADLGKGVRTPLELLYHINDVLWMAYTLAQGRERVHLTRRSWTEEVDRFYEMLEKLDALFCERFPEDEKTLLTLVQGPLTDAATHIGQLAMISRLAGEPVERVSYVQSEVVIGRFRYE